MAMNISVFIIQKIFWSNLLLTRLHFLLSSCQCLCGNQMIDPAWILILHWAFPLNLTGLLLNPPSWIWWNQKIQTLLSYFHFLCWTLWTNLYKQIIKITQGISSTCSRTFANIDNFLRLQTLKHEEKIK